MEVIKINVKEKIASVEGSPIIVCGNSDYTMAFTFDDEWNDEENKVARFSYVKKGLKGFIDVPIHDGICQVPVLIGIGLVRVGAYAGNLRTTTGAKIKCQKSILCDDAEEMAEPFENLYEELVEKINNIAVSGGGLVEITEDAQITELSKGVYRCNADNGAGIYFEGTCEYGLVDGIVVVSHFNGGIYQWFAIGLNPAYYEIAMVGSSYVDDEGNLLLESVKDLKSIPTAEDINRDIEVHQEQVDTQMNELEERLVSYIGGIENGSY